MVGKSVAAVITRMGYLCIPQLAYPRTSTTARAVPHVGRVGVPPGTLPAASRPTPSRGGVWGRQFPLRRRGGDHERMVAARDAVPYGDSLKLSQYHPRYCIASENLSKLAGFVT